MSGNRGTGALGLSSNNISTAIFRAPVATLAPHLWLSMSWPAHISAVASIYFHASRSLLSTSLSTAMQAYQHCLGHGLPDVGHTFVFTLQPLARGPDQPAEQGITSTWLCVPLTAPMCRTGHCSRRHAVATSDDGWEPHT